MNLMATPELIDEMVRRVVDQFHPRTVVLFGSHARGTARADSDVDLLVDLDECGNRREAAVAIRRLLGDLPIGKDVLVATPAMLDEAAVSSNSVLCQAVKEGRALYERA